MFSLRQAYEPEWFLFLPQGHFPSIFHRLIQRFLSFFYEPDVLWPRIDYFTYISVLLAHSLSIVSFWWAFKPIRSYTTKIFLVAFWLFLYYLNGWHGLYLMLSLDYLAWISPVAIIGAGLIIRWVEPRPWQLNEAILLGLYMGMAIGVKVSLVLFPAVLGLFLLLRSGNIRRSFVMGSVSFGIGIALGWLILLIFYSGNTKFVSSYFLYLNRFMAGELARYDLGVLEFMTKLATQVSWEVSLIGLSPILFLALLSLVRTRIRFALILPLLIGSIAYVLTIYLRFSPTTIFEAAAFMMMGFFIIGLIAFSNWPVSGWIRIPEFIIFFVAVSFLISQGKQIMGHGYLVQIEQNHRAQHQLKEILTEVRKPLAFLIPNNHYRPVSVDSGIFKGGGSLSGGSFPDTTFVKRLFPNRDYFSGPAEKFQDNPVDFLGYGSVLFTIPYSAENQNDLDYYLSQIDNSVQEMEDYYHASLQGHDCRDWIDFGRTAAPRVMVLCHRKSVSVKDIPQTEGLVLLREKGYWYLSDEERGVPTARTFVLDNDGNNFLVSGSEGEKFRFKNVGPWNKMIGAMSGMIGFYHNERWIFEHEGLAPANNNPGLDIGSADKTIPGYWFSPGNVEVTFKQMNDQSGKFIRITAQSTGSHMAITGNVPLQQLNGVPLSVRAQIRTSQTIDASLTLTDMLSEAGEALSHKISLKPLLHEWISIVVRAPKVEYPHSSDNYAVAIGPVKSGDYFDIRELSVFVGVLP